MVTNVKLWVPFAQRCLISIDTCTNITKMQC